jgi:O-methyltransferase
MSDITTLLRVRPYTEVDARRLAHLAELAATVPGGAIVECGTAKGGSAAMMAAHSAAHCWLYDTFTGLPAPTAIDGTRALRYVGANQASVEDVQAAMESVGVPRDRYTIRVGNFRDTFRDNEGPAAVALLHIDADWYESVRLSLEHWVPRVVSGGTIVLDDFGCWPGCRSAFYEFVHAHRIRPDLNRCGDQAWWIV